jgi:SagB-type dehydrogenase family enzyme
MDPLETVYHYHTRTKHQLGRYARSPGQMDWNTKPYPFRRHKGAVMKLLPQTNGPLTYLSWDNLFESPISPAPFNDETLGAFFYLSMALSAWKEVVDADGEIVSRWALRVNPSSGNLHPTEAWLADANGVHHYCPDIHGLEQTAVWPAGAWEKLMGSLPSGTIFIGLSSIPWRESWKYGERAFRYCQHDAGHAMAALSVAAAALGWSVASLKGAGTEKLTAMLGIGERPTHEAEHADTMFALMPAAELKQEVSLDLLRAENLDTPPNVLSSDHLVWEIIDEVAAATAYPSQQTVRLVPAPTRTAVAAPSDRNLNAFQIIRRRRSAVAMDGQTSMKLADFNILLKRLMPHPNNPAFDLFQTRTAVSLLLMIHRVDGLQPGLYMLIRDPQHLADLKQNTSDTWQWSRSEDTPSEVPLYFLGGGDLRLGARQLSCNQAIASDGVFSVGMLARFDHTLQSEGPESYPELFRETGAIGQMLYLEAEAAGLRGTGIGCFFDDEVHRVLGLADQSWQSLYHFTVGGAVDDERLRTAEPYDQKTMS